MHDRVRHTPSAATHPARRLSRLLPLLSLLLLVVALLPTPARAAQGPASLVVTFRQHSAFRPDFGREWLLESVTTRQRVAPREVAWLARHATVAELRFAGPAQAGAALARLRQHPDVLRVEPAVTRRLAQWTPADPDYDEQRAWLEPIDALAAWQLTTGAESVVVAVIDSGVSPTHPDLVNRLVPGYNAVDDTNDASDIDGHGTHVAGIIAAEGGNGAGTAGVAMDVRIMPIRVVDAAGEIDVADEIEAIYWAVDNGADVVNLSLGSEEYVQAERDAVRYAYERGVVVVAAAGNHPTELSYPANYDEAISVGTVRADGQPAEFTSRLSRVDLAAPGEAIYSPGWDSFYGDYWDSIFYADGAPVTGTSFSAAIVSGAAALLKAVMPQASVEQVRSLLRGTATDTGEPGSEAGTGAGRLDLEAAVREAVAGAMRDVWTTTDGPVASTQAVRTWQWGERSWAWTTEPYAETQHGARLVHYYDKSRMEVTDPLDDRANAWYVTNGLLATELITGQLQLGDATFEARAPAEVNVAGDPTDPRAPTYASFSTVLTTPAIGANEPIMLTIDRSGRINAESRLASYGVTGTEWVPETRHRVASVFWTYLNSSGLIQRGDQLVVGRLFEPWFYATGFPITEAFWTRVQVRGIEQDVLVQCFQRRCLTYTPANPDGWQVEMGNVGRHYYEWRYGTPPPTGETTRAVASSRRNYSLRQLWSLGLR